MADKFGLDIDDYIKLLGIGTQVAGGVMDRRAAQEQLDTNLSDNQENRAAELELSRLNATNNASAFASNDRASREQVALSATQLDPYKQQNSLYSTAVRRALGQQGPPQIERGKRGVQNRVDLSGVSDQFLNDDALANALGHFEKARIGAAGGYATPLNMEATGLGPAGASRQQDLQDFQGARLGETMDENAARQANVDKTYNSEAIQKALMTPRADGSYPYNEADQRAKAKKGSIWKKVAKVGLIGGGLLATAATGGAASPLLAAAIGAGTGAASGALDGGWKGALVGAGMGAATGGLTKGLKIPGVTPGVNKVAGTLASGAVQNTLPMLNNVYAPQAPNAINHAALLAALRRR